MKNFGAASAQLATFLLGGFVLRDERWLKELRIKYDEQRRGSCDAACSVPSLCWGEWSGGRSDGIPKALALEGESEVSVLRAAQVRGRVAAGREEPKGLRARQEGHRAARYRRQLQCLGEHVAPRPRRACLGRQTYWRRSYESNTMRSVGAVATACSCAASAQLATFLLGGFVLRDERWLEELRIKYDEKRRGSCDAACSVPSLC